MITCVVYEPDADDQSSGRIIYTVQAPLVVLEANEWHWIEVEAPLVHYSNTHRVLKGQVIIS